MEAPQDIFDRFHSTTFAVVKLEILVLQAIVITMDFPIPMNSQMALIPMTTGASERALPEQGMGPMDPREILTKMD